MLKSYSELSAVDVLPYCDYREAKDDKGKKIQVPYLNWATCKNLLHENGAETVYYTPLKTSEGSYLFRSADVENKDGRKTGCWFVSVEIHIDDHVFTMDMPLMNGSLVVYEDTLNQLRIANAHARAFVKGVAIHTGLGFSLWCSDKDTEQDPDDLSGHSIMAVKRRIEMEITAKLQKGMEMDDILSLIGINRRQFENTMKALDNAQWIEKKILEL